jgi:DNA-binding transcriptional regulator YdaS (Cro superfamily)
MTRSLDEILNVLGGESAVANLLRCGPPSVSNWKARGLPKGRWVDLVMLGAEKGIRPPITLDEVRQASRAIEDARAKRKQLETA